MRKTDQKRRDLDRKTYKINFPHGLDADCVTAWIRSVSGTLRGHRSSFTGKPTIAFEMWAAPEGITHRLKVPWQHADYVVAQLRSLVPGIRVTPEEEFPHKLWTRAVEVGLTRSSRTLRIYDAATTSASLLASVQALEAGEALLLQWVVSPAIPAKAPIYTQARTDSPNVRSLWKGTEASRDEVNDRRHKLEEPNVLAVLRVAAVASTTVRADHLIYRVRSSLASTRTSTTRFVKRIVKPQTLQKRIDTTATSLLFPMQLSATELTALLAWPIGNPFVSGLPAALARQLPANENVPRKGRIIGKSTFPGNERDVAVAYADAVKHMHVLGPSGSGKTVLLANMLKQDVDQGYGVVLIESKGDLFRAALDAIPPNRMQDLIVLDVNDRQWPVGFNVLNQGDPRVVVDEICALFEYLYHDTRGVWTREVLYHGLSTLISHPGSTFADLATLLMPMTSEEVRWADEVRRGSSKELRQFWQRFENQPRPAQDRFVQPVMDRIWQLNARSELRNIIGQSESSFQMADVIAQHKILLVNLENIGKDTASLTGTLIMNAVWHAVRSNPTPDTPNFLYLDEFQDFINLPVDPEDMLAKARSFGLGMVLAHQHVGQLPPHIRQAVLNNARTKVVFQASADDARIMSREFGNAVDESDFMHLGQYEALTRVVVGGSVEAPLTLVTNPPARGFGRAREARDISRGRYGRPVADVQAEQAKRYGTIQTKPGTRRPSIGSL